MGQFHDTTIRDVICDLNVHYFLPDVQRDYVWLNNEREKKIERLFDSIMRDFPIGSFLFWKLQRNDIASSKFDTDESKLNFQLYKFLERYDIRDTENPKIDVSQLNVDDLHIVLDGQQRLTSLYIGLKGSRILKKPRLWWDNPNAFEEKKLYLNLLYKPTFENPDDAYEFVFFNPDKLPANDAEHLWFKVGDILDINPIEYARNNNLGWDVLEILGKLSDKMTKEHIISYFEEKEKNLDKVLQIFIRVNSGGTPLSYSDLLMSILTATFSSDIRDLMHRFVKSIADAGFPVMGRDQILKTSLMLTGCNHIFKLENFNKKNINEIESKWDVIVEKINDSIRVVDGFGYAYQLSSGYIISAIAYYLTKKDISFIHLSSSDLDAMKKFVQNAQILSYFTSALDSKLNVCKDAIDKAQNFEDVNKTLAEQAKLRLTAADIDWLISSATYGSYIVLPVLQMLYPHLDYKNARFHIDHIYPKAKFAKRNKALPAEFIEKRNDLFNLQMLEGTENIQKSDCDPSEWLTRQFGDDNEKINDYKSRNYIAENASLTWEDIALFEKDRINRIKTRLTELLS